MARALKRRLATGTVGARLGVCLWFLGLFLLGAGHCEIAWADVGTAQVPHCDPDIQFAIDTLRKAIADGELSEVVPDLQRLHEKIWGENYLYTATILGRAGRAETSVSASDYLIELMRSLPGEAREIYRKEFDVPATSLHQRSLWARDPEGLVRCYGLYPLATPGEQAALEAGDLFFEGGDLPRATECWDFIRFDAPLELRRARALRGLLVASARGSSAEYDRWHVALEEIGGASGVDGVMPPRPDAPVDVDPLAGLGDLPFPRGKIGWETVAYRSQPFGVYYGYGDEINYTQRACVHDDWVAVSTSSHLRRYGLATGKLLRREVRLPGPTRFRQYEERDRHLRLAPVTDGEVLVTSYAADVNVPEDFFGYDISIAVARRGLKAVTVKAGRELWDTARQRRDPDLARFSFNSQPVIVGDRLYALGWRESGYVVCYLVCLELKSGRALWKTILAGNQIELTMFGEIAMEPFLGEIVVEEGVVYASTNLGVFAAVRARDGAIRWATEYQTLAVRAARRNRQRSQRQTRWARNPLVSFRDRIIVTPFDSSLVLALDKKNGRLLQSIPYSRVGRRSHGIFLLGRRGTQLVFCTGQKLVLIPILDLQSDGPRLELTWTTNARPALLREGVVYSSKDGGLRYRPFREGREESEIYTPPARSRGGDSTVVDGAVTVLPDRVLVTNSYRIRCFVERAITRPPQEKR